MKYKKRSINIRLLFNEEECDLNNTRRKLQEQLRIIDSYNQEWITNIQTCADPIFDVKILHHVPTFDMTPLVKRESLIIKKNTGLDIEVLITHEVDFEKKRIGSTSLKI